MPKYTDEQMKKALECCSGVGCKECSFRCDSATCIMDLNRAALDLNNRQEAEIDEFCSANLQLVVALENAKSEAIKECNNKTLMYLDKFKSEIMDKFISMCAGNDYNKVNLLTIGDTIDCIYDDFIDNLIKEMIGESK